jgi:hypothetical protein
MTSVTFHQFGEGCDSVTGKMTEMVTVLTALPEILVMLNFLFYLKLHVSEDSVSPT